MSDVPTITDFLKAQAEAEIEDALLEAEGAIKIRALSSPGYAIRPLDRNRPSIKQLHASKQAVVAGHRPPNSWAIKVSLGRDPRRFTFGCPTRRDAEHLGKQFIKQLLDYLDDESADNLWNVFVLRAARHVDARLRQVGGIDPPNQPVTGPRAADGHEHVWHWTGTWTEAKPFPVWHMRCACGFWALLANQVGTESGEWIAFDEAVHDIRDVEGNPIS